MVKSSAPCQKKKKNTAQNFWIFDIHIIDSFIRSFKHPYPVPVLFIHEQMSVFAGSAHAQTYIWIDLILTILSSIVSVVTILVINKMRLTGYIKLILTMTWFQLIYDASFFNGTQSVGGYWVVYVANVFQLVGGIGSSLISNWIAFVVFYVVYNKRSIDIMKNYNYMLASATVPAIIIAIIYSCGSIPENSSFALQNLANLGFYYYTRLISIFFNFVLFGLASYFNHLIRSKGLGKTPAEMAINTLCRRLMYYPLLQVTKMLQLFL